MRSEKGVHRLVRVAPVRERGLKSPHAAPPETLFCRSREGAWIEMHRAAGPATWRRVAPVRERGLKFTVIASAAFVAQRRSREGAWIEMPNDYR